MSDEHAELSVTEVVDSLRLEFPFVGNCSFTWPGLTEPIAPDAIDATLTVTALELKTEVLTTARRELEVSLELEFAASVRVGGVVQRCTSRAAIEREVELTFPAGANLSWSARTGLGAIAACAVPGPVPTVLVTGPASLSLDLTVTARRRVQVPAEAHDRWPGESDGSGADTDRECDTSESESPEDDCSAGEE